MKKSLFFIVLLSLATLGFAKSFEVYATRTFPNVVSDLHGYSTSSITTKNNVVITMAVKRYNASNLKVYVDIENYGTVPFYFDENQIFAFQGNHEVDKWSMIDYIPATKAFRKIQMDNAGDNKTQKFFAGVSIAFSDLQDKLEDQDVNLPFAKDKYSRIYSLETENENQRIILESKRNDDILAKMDSSGTSSNYLKKNLLYSKMVNPMQGYSGIFYLPIGNEPDYKIQIDISPIENSVFYFERSDRWKVLHPFGDNDDSKLIFASGVEISPNSDLKGFSVYLLYDAVPLGTYLAIGPCANSLVFDSHMGIKVSLGFEAKVFPYTWLMAGIGTKFNTYTNEFNIAPQLGFNHVIGPLCIGYSAEYAHTKGLSFNFFIGGTF